MFVASLQCTLSSLYFFRHSDIEIKSTEPFNIYSTLPRSLRDTKLVTNVKVEEDEERLKARQEMVNTKSPAELAQISGPGDLPIPSRLTRLVTRGSRAQSRAKSSGPGSEAVSTTKSMRRGNILNYFCCDAWLFFTLLAIKFLDQLLFQQSKHQRDVCDLAKRANHGAGSGGQSKQGPGRDGEEEEAM